MEHHCHPPDSMEEELPPAEEDEFEYGEPFEEIIDEWELLAGQTAHRNPAERQEDPNRLGERTEDWRYNWAFHVGQYTGTGLDAGKAWWKAAKEREGNVHTVHWHSQDVVDKLSREQRVIYDTVISHYQRRSSGLDRRPLLLNIDGRAGTGKSFLIQVLSAHLRVLAGGNREIIVRCAPTGAASYGILGSTLHSLFKLPVGKAKFQKLAPAQVQALQLKLAGIQYVIIDEKSMVSLATLARIEQRLQQAFPASEELFGGVSILLIGDFWQLPPVADKALYSNPHQIQTTITEPATIAGVEASRPVDSNIHRQMGLRNQTFSSEDMYGFVKYRAFNQSVELVVQ